MKRIVWIVVLALCCFVGCKGKQEKAEPVDAAVIYTRGQGFSKEGITFLKKGIVQYTDFATGETMPLCSRLNCPHRKLTESETENGAEPCMAYVKDAYQAVLYREKLYVFTIEKGGICIYISDADGANRKLLAELSGAMFRGGFSTEFYGNSLAMMTSQSEISSEEDGEIEVESYYKLYCIDCVTGQVTECTKEWDNSATIYGMDDTSVYVYYDYTDEAVYERYTMEELSEDPLLAIEYKRGELWKCSLEDGSADELLPGEFRAHRSLLDVNKNGAVIGDSQDGTEKTVYYSFERGEEVAVLADSCRVLWMEDDSVVLSATDEHTDSKVIYRFDCEEGSLKKIETDPALLPSRMMGGNLYFSEAVDRTRVMSLDEFLSGGSEALYFMDKIIYETYE